MRGCAQVKLNTLPDHKKAYKIALFPEKMAAGPFQTPKRHHRRSRLTTAAEITFKSTELAALFDLGAVQTWHSGMAVRTMSIACLCWLRGNSVCTRFTHVCPCHAWGALMEQLMRMHGWQSTGADIAFIELVRRCSCSCRCENFLSRNSRPFCSLSTSSMTTSLELCGSAPQRDCGVFASACPTATQGA